jgi:hypothetical protein
MPDSAIGRAHDCAAMPRLLASYASVTLGAPAAHALGFGGGGLWQLQRQPDTTGPTPWGEAALQHWRRQPSRPEGLLVDVWLAREAGTPAGAGPVRLRMQVPRSGDVVDLQWLAAP